jgi:hypothetical protein
MMIYKFIFIFIFTIISAVFASEKDDVLEIVENDSVLQENTDNDIKGVGLIKKSSLFYEQKEINQLYNVLDLIKKGISPDEALLALNVESNEVKKILKTSISFYLNAILYYSPSSWSVWINNNKITQDKNNTDLEVIKIDADYVEFRWVTGYTKFVNIVQVGYYNKGLPKNINIDIKDGIATIDFVIKPNQSLTINDDVSIIEGRENIQ